MRKKNSQYCGNVGSPIEGSKLVRDYCDGCGEAMRVAFLNIPAYCTDCTDCRPVRFPVGFQADSAIVQSEILYHGEW